MFILKSCNNDFRYKGRRQRWALDLCFIIVVVTSLVAQQQLTKISGIVSDPTGAAIPNASVELESSGNTHWRLRARARESARCDRYGCRYRRSNGFDHAFQSTWAGRTRVCAFEFIW